MTAKGYTDITVLVDRSGSMSAIKTEMESGFAVFAERQRDEFLGMDGSVSKQEKCLLTVTQFDDGNPAEPVYVQCPITESFSNFSIVPRGNTPLLDALGKAITTTGERLAALPEPARPDRVLFVVVTDGQENASRDWKKSTLESQIKEQREKYGWQFTFIGANYENFAEASALGIQTGAILSGSSIYGLWTSVSSSAARFVATAKLAYSVDERTRSA